jgi:hypothetical protein
MIVHVKDISIVSSVLLTKHHVVRVEDSERPAERLGLRHWVTVTL